MKKIISILLCCFLLCSVLVCSVSAASDDIGPTWSDLKGLWLLNEDLPYNDDYTVDFVYMLEFYLYDRVNGGLGEQLDMMHISLNSKGDPCLFYKKSTSSSLGYEVYNFSSGRRGWTDDLFRYIYFPYGDLEGHEDTLGVWLIQNSTQLVCDGSTCPVYDSDNDGFCDDCYRSTRLTAGEHVVYPSYLPKLPEDVGFEGWNHIIMKNDDSYSLYSYVADKDNSYYVWGNSNNDDVILESTASYATGNKYDLVDGQWKYKGILAGDYTIGKQSDIVWSSLAVYDENGNYFFPLALWAQILKTSQGALKMETPKTTQTMKILIVCGVGCLALLIGLPLLLKVFRKFRVR